LPNTFVAESTALLLSVHLLLVDLAMTGPLACVWMEWRQSRASDELAGDVGRRLASASAWALVAGIATGLVLLGVRWRFDPAYLRALADLPASRLWFAGVELGFSLACLGGYAILWDRMQRRRIFHRLLALAGTSNLIVHFPFLFVVVSVITTRRFPSDGPLDRAEYQRLLLDSEVLSRVTHVWLAALAVGGAALMGLAVRCEQRSAAQPLVARGAAVALAACLLQIPTGVWMTLELPESVRQPLLGGDLLTSGLFLTAVVLALWLVHTLGGIALGDFDTRQVRRSIAMVVGVIMLMVLARCRVHGPRPSANITVDESVRWSGPVESFTPVTVI
jgi:cytochrome bd-type quinol oxidase subunit 1